MVPDVSQYRLADAQIWGGQPSPSDPLPAAFQGEHFGTLIDGPRTVVLSAAKTLPLYAYYMGSFRQMFTRRFIDQALVVAIDPDENELYVARAIPDEGERKRVQDPTKPEDLPEGSCVEAHTLDLRERANIPWKPGPLTVQILMLDLPSNRLQMVRRAGAGSYQDEEKEKFLAAERARRDPDGPYPRRTAQGRYPLWERSDASPEAPAPFGLNLKAERVVVVEDKPSILLHGAWRLPVAPHETVKPSSTTHNEAQKLFGADGRTPLAACLSIYLVAIASSNANPYIYRLRVPIPGPLAEGANSPEASGFFTIDLAQLPDFPLIDQSLFLYGFAKEWASDPLTIGIIDRRTN